MGTRKRITIHDPETNVWKRYLRYRFGGMAKKVVVTEPKNRLYY